MPMFALGLAALGASVGSAIHAKKQDKKNQKMTQSQIDLANQRQQMLDQVGNPFLRSGQDNMNTVQNALQQQINTRQGAMEYAAPDINRMTQQQQGAVAAQRSMYPRGGATASQSANLPFQLQGNINNLLFENKRQAVGQLGQLGANQTSLGLSAMGQGAGLTNSMLQYGLDARRLSMEQGMALGQGVGGIGQLMLQYFNSRPQNTAVAPNTPYQTLPGNLNWNTGGSINFPGQNNSGGSMSGQSSPAGNAYTSYLNGNPNSNTGGNR